MSIELKSSRLTLRLPRAEDAERIVTGLSDFEVIRWLPAIPFPYALPFAHEWLDKITPESTPGQATFAIDLVGEGLVGCIGIERELGFWLAQPFWGRGLMTEAAELLLDWHFSSGSEQLGSGAVAGNDRSLAVQKKLGFVESGNRRTVYVNALQSHAERIDTVLTREAYGERRR
ncbi:MAG TPA: GNAT family N-acetyltransferase [Devosiaceae bacterium]|jgi:RimJ/RimL family protein N-acetyltransferase